HTAFNVELSPTKPDKYLSHTHRPLAPIIKDWVFDLEDDSEAEIPHYAPSFVQPPKQVKNPRPSVKTIETSIPAANHKTAIPKPTSHGNSKNRKACFMYDRSAAKKEIWNGVMTCRKIINWRACLKFTKEPKVTKEARDMICHFLYDVESRLGTGGVDEIKAHTWFNGVNSDTQNFEKFPEVRIDVY
nr:serine/threonine-protein kinase tricorner [Tanacetum cinerariifolium]